jgi:hypothetical protein
MKRLWKASNITYIAQSKSPATTTAPTIARYHFHTGKVSHGKLIRLLISPVAQYQTVRITSTIQSAICCNILLSATELTYLKAYPYDVLPTPVMTRLYLEKQIESSQTFFFSNNLHNSKRIGGFFF